MNRGLFMPSSLRFSRTFIKQLIVIFVLAVTTWVYIPSLSNGFINWDDDVHVLENRFIRSVRWPNIVEMFTTTVNRTYIPLTTLTFAIEHEFLGFDPFYYHLDNLILHVLVTFLVMALARRLGFSIVAAAIAALLFGIHPLHVESVAWITERKDVLYAFFYLSSILVYLQYLRSRHSLWLVLSIACGLLSVLSKSMALSLPLVLLLCDWYVLKTITWRDVFNKFYYGFLFLPIVWITFFSNSSILKAQSWTDALVWVWSFNFYLFKFIVPGPTALFYDAPFPIGINNGEYLVNGLVFILFVTLIWLRRNDRLLLFAFLFYLASIFFVLRFHATLDVVADRFMYLSSVGWCFFLGAVIERLINLGSKKEWVFCVVAVLTGWILFLTANTNERLTVWRNSHALWQNQLKNARTADWLAWSKLGDAYFEEALSDGVFTRLYKRKEDLPVLQDRDAQQLAVILRSYHNAINAKPDYAQPYYHLGLVHESLGDIKTATHFYEQAYTLSNEHFMAAFKLGNMYARQGRASEAVEFYQRAITISPYNQEVKQSIINELARLIKAEGHSQIYKEAYTNFFRN